MDNDIAIKVTDIKKTFKLPHQKTDSIKTVFLSMFNGGRSFERQEVLKGVSFEVKKGEFLGIVGRNGGGKSTLLKLLAEVYLPDSGTIEINGSLTPFIELGVGFNPDLTGRENVYLNGSLLGFDRKAMDGMYDEIVAFAELGQFMDQKLKNYSSGMQVRLAFSVAIQAKTDILLIDEVLAVGDSNFQKKCFDVFENFKQEGRTVIFISHSMQQVAKFCDRAILINEGTIKVEGDPEVVAIEYDMLNNDDQKNNDLRLKPKTVREAHIVENVLAEFKTSGGLLELGAGDGRLVELIDSLGIDIVGVSPVGELSKGVVRNVKDVGSVNDRDGLLILDNLKSLSVDFIDATLKELNSGRLSGVRKIYIHLPFDEYQRYVQDGDSSSLSHLAQPLSVSKLIEKFGVYGFSVTSLGNYGADQPMQYIDCVLKRFDDKEKAKLWESSRN